jgi:hypothetical protein
MSGDDPEVREDSIGITEKPAHVPKILELEKRRNLSKTQHQTSTPISHAPGWNEALATESEAFVKVNICSRI